MLFPAEELEDGFLYDEEDEYDEDGFFVYADFFEDDDPPLLFNSSSLWRNS